MKQTALHLLARALMAGHFLAIGGCGAQMVQPELDRVTPEWGYNGQGTPLVLSGENLYPSVEASDGTSVKLDQAYRAWLLTSPPTELDAVDLIDYHRISAVVPPGVEPGLYSLRVQSPAGDQADLPDSFQVTDTLADHIRADADQITWTVQDNAVVSLQVRDLTGAIVPLPLEVRIYATGSAVGEGFSFLTDTLIEQSRDPASGGIRGKLRADGQGYVAFTTDTPGEVQLTIEPQDPDSVVRPGSQLVSFQAGRAMTLDLTLPDDDFLTNAGASFEVGVRMVDSLGNTVTGVPASVLLTESCPGGTLSTFLPLVDEAVAVVAATAATGSGCAVNHIVAVGVAEGATISGTSEGFNVNANLLHHLDVAAAPTAVTAGTGVLNISVTAVDAWSNRVLSAVGGIELSDETGIIAPEQGNGTQSCGSLIDGVGVCTATLFRGGISRSITVSAEAGAVGESNLITVLPGPGDHLDVDIDVSTVEAGAAFSVSTRMVDAFENSIELTESELSSLDFYDESGPIDCIRADSDGTGPTYSFTCICTVAQSDNIVHAVLDSLASVGDSSAFDVLPAELQVVSVDLGLEGVGVAIAAGDTLTAELVGFDAFGNQVDDDLELDLTDTARGVSPTSASLVDGAGEANLSFTSALIGNTVSIMADEALLGTSEPFDVLSGPADSIIISTGQPWVWTDHASTIRLTPVDVFGNVVPDAADTITLSSQSGLGPDVSVSLVGETLADFHFEAAGLNDSVLATGSSLSGTSEPIDVVTDCVDGPTVDLTVIGATHHSLCLGVDDVVAATLSITPEDLHITHFLGGGISHRTEDAAVEHVFEGDGRTPLTALGIRVDGCAEEVTETIYHGPVGPPVGEIAVSLADGTLIAGTTGGDERTRVNFSARSCTGDLADGGEILVRAGLGELQSTAGSALTSTGSGLQLELDSAGEGSLRWTMAEVRLGGAPEIFAGTRLGSSLGISGASVSGDNIPPAVIETTPMGMGGGLFSEVELVFTEAMLMSLTEETTLDAVSLTSPEGDLIAWTSASWSSDGVILTMHLEAPEDAGLGPWTLEVLDELRDEAGNRLDGDLDGSPGGTLSLSFGASGAMPPAVTRCQPTTNLFRPDGDPGPGLEADEVILSVSTDGPAAWWRKEVIDASGALIFHERAAPAGTASGDVSWDGRDQSGEVVPNGLYRLDLVPTDMDWNAGTGCSITLRVDNHLSPASAP